MHYDINCRDISMNTCNIFNHKEDEVDRIIKSISESDALMKMFTVWMSQFQQGYQYLIPRQSKYSVVDVMWERYKRFTLTMWKYPDFREILHTVSK